MQANELKELLNQLSLEEKIGELFQLPSYFFSGSNVTGPAAELGITDEDLAVSGSCLSIVGAKKIQEIQSTHIKNHPHNIPMMFMADIINGYQTIFPIPLAQGCTFHPEMVEEAASVAACEAAASGVQVTFSPMADLSNDARWGRVMESTGEDPYLNGQMAAAMVRGYQGRENDLTKKGKIGACLKHFAAYGAPQAGRDYNNVELSERTLRQDYLPAYKDAIDAGCALVMTSFNTLNRIPSSGNRWLMRDVLRSEMNFSGVLISDWMAVSELLVHGIAADQAEAAKLALEAGVDIDMASPIYLKNTKELIEKGVISKELLDECVLRVLTLKNNLGLFENPYKDASEEDEAKLLLCEEHRALARKCAEESFVLLKNDDSLLPLKKENEKVAFMGPFVTSHLLYGSWSFFANDDDGVTIKEGIEKNYPDSHVAFTMGCSIVDPGINVLGFQKTPPAELYATEDELAKAIEDAVNIAKTVDKVVLTLGEPRDYTGEGASKANITLPSCQIKLLQRVYEVNKNICVVLINGRPLDLREVDTYAKSILEVWLPGTEGGNAIARTLYGDNVPSGKLTMSFPYCVGQVPVFYNHMRTGRPFTGDFRKERYASQYLDIPNAPLYPFGHGLSYTTFSYSDITLDKKELSADGTITASITVTNTGNCTGAETVQMYIHDVAASVTRPVRELKGFKKVTLAPGESAVVSFEINEQMLRFYDINMEFKSEKGAFEVFIGTNSNATAQADFRLV